MKSENMFQWLQSKLHESGVAREDSGSQTDLNVRDLDIKISIIFCFTLESFVSN